jgi:trans-aconitate methyltransferase
MSLKSKAKTLAERLTGTYIYRQLPRGIDFASDMKRFIPMYRVNTVFDVGANVGQSAKLFLAEFPNSHIYCL